MILAVCLLPLGCGTRPVEAPAETPSGKLAYLTNSVTISGAVERRLVEQFTAQTGIRVLILPGLEGGALAQTRGFLESKAQSPDIYLVDIVWIGTLQEHLLDLTPLLGSEVDDLLPTAIENNTTHGRLVAMPTWTDAGLLYYRKDLLAKYGFSRPPDTWDELESMAARIQAGERAQGNQDFWGFVWQGAATESLTCNALEWQVSHGGGGIIERNGTISVNNPKAVRAFQRAARWVGHISPAGVLAYREEDSRNIWQAGNAAFMRNWPYAYTPAQAEGSLIRDKVEVGQLPSGGAGHAHTLGGWQLGISKYSTHSADAVTLVRHLVGRAAQGQRAVEASVLPTRLGLYDAPEVLRVNPYFGPLKRIFLGGAAVRPSTVTGRLYPEVSAAYVAAVHAILEGKTAAAPALAALEAQLVQITGFKTAPPAQR